MPQIYIEEVIIIAVQFEKTGVVNASGEGVNPNLLTNSRTIVFGKPNWVLGSGASQDGTDENGMTIIKNTGTSANWSALIELPLISYATVRDKTIILSFLAKSNISTQIQYFTASLCTSSSTTRTKYFTFGSFTPTTEWKQYFITNSIADAKFTSGSGTVATTDRFYLQFYNHYTDANVWVKQFKLELGSVATPWCPNETDDIYTGTAVGFAEANGNPSIGKAGYVQATEFIEW